VKSLRQRKIIEIISSLKIETQEELANSLRKLGFVITQATISRDIKELGLIKVPNPAGSYHYAVPQEIKVNSLKERLRRLFIENVLKLDFSENLIIVHTLSGTAHAVAASLDKAEWPNVIGTVAGDDTILIVVKPKTAVETVMLEMQALLQ
jgi:transcriptional regulator of arginine metabolism